jgi:hypothetical protein
LLLLSLQELYWLESCDSATEEDKAELRQLDCNFAMEEEEDNFVLLGGWLSEMGQDENGTRKVDCHCLQGN